MKKKLRYFLRSYLGFTQRESKGFVLVIPVLTFLAIIPRLLAWYGHQSSEDIYQGYLLKVDSLSAVVERDSGALFQQIGDRRAVFDTGSWEDYRERRPELMKMDFAEADSAVLQVVPGIGPTLAGRIVKFRQSLGGLHQKEQLLDVYGLKMDVAKRVFEYFSFTPAIYQQLPLNTSSPKELAAHPYIRYGEAKVIVAYREQHGQYRSLDDLLRIKIFSKEWLERVKPYLNLE
ncbi:helix-hairpin-helix domain-containing protein [Echinicola strongylocentroti]|uniref:Helix-hairpin-helix domain-containing protein n=1 Tax=Echinicola strongylocentroti TaxID=1795355 RepID=A0A2Z4IHM7_9BACT|nr:helix-hairpin-helix domain-containing protein [Echinicola strongylocentroti]AWW29923.1 helix-hairpin-helix domain-containing protein [Echinicola strongylocentroti]